MVVIEMNPRVSRSSRARLQGDRLPDRQGRGEARRRLHARRARERHHRRRDAGLVRADASTTWSPRCRASRSRSSRRPNDRLTTQMKSVGEVMAIGRTFQESFQKALRGLEIGVDGLEPARRATARRIEQRARRARPRAHLVRRRRVRDGFTLDEVTRLTRIDPWFLDQIEQIVELEMDAGRQEARGRSTRERLRELKRKGFSDRRLALPVQHERRGGAREAARARHPPGVQARRHLRGRVRDPDRLHVLDLRGGVRGAARPSARRS